MAAGPPREKRQTRPRFVWQKPFFGGAGGWITQFEQAAVRVEILAVVSRFVAVDEFERTGIVVKGVAMSSFDCAASACLRISKPQIRI